GLLSSQGVDLAIVVQPIQDRFRLRLRDLLCAPRDCPPADDSFQAASPPTRTEIVQVCDGHVADLTRAVGTAFDNMPACHDSAANPRADHHHDQIADALPKPEAMFA